MAINDKFTYNGQTFTAKQSSPGQFNFFDQSGADTGFYATGGAGSDVFGPNQQKVGKVSTVGYGGLPGSLTYTGGTPTPGGTTTPTTPATPTTPPATGGTTTPPAGGTTPATNWQSTSQGQITNAFNFGPGTYTTKQMSNGQYQFIDMNGNPTDFYGTSDGKVWKNGQEVGTVQLGYGGQPGEIVPNPNTGPDIFQPDKFQSSQSGLPTVYQEQLLKDVLPKLLASLGDYKGDIDKSTAAAQELYQSQTKQGMKKGLQGILNSLAGKNMLNSSVASDTISKGMSDIIQGGADKGYETSMLNAGLKAQYPSLLGSITQLGTGSFSSDPLAPYKLLAQYDWNLM